MNDYFLHVEQKPLDNYLDKPFIFPEGAKTKNKIAVQSFSPNNIGVKITADSTTTLILQQNFYPHWFYKTNGKNQQVVNQSGINFMSAPVGKGQNNIEFIFEPTAVKWTMLLSAFVFVMYSLILLVSWVKRSSPS